MSSANKCGKDSICDKVLKGKKKCGDTMEGEFPTGKGRETLPATKNED